MRQNLYTLRHWIALAICILGLSIHQSASAQQRRFALAIRNVQVANNQTSFSFGDEVRLRFQIVNASNDTILLRGEDSLEVNIMYRFIQANAPIADSARLSRDVLRNTRILPGDSLPFSSAQRNTIPLSSSQLMPGGTVVVIWPRGAYVIPADSGRIEFDITPTDRRPLVQANLLSAYPNPSSELPWFDINNEVQSMQIFNAKGQIILSGTLSLELRQMSATLPAGLYNLILQDETGRVHHVRWLKP